MNTQPSGGLSNSRPAPADRAKALAATLLSERGEASGAQVARELQYALRALDADARHGFRRYLAAEFQPDQAALRMAAQRYLANATAEAAAALAQAADPPRQELLRRMNMAPGGTGALIAMRSELNPHLRDEP
jgi:malonyl-CoA decarboxylase